MLGNAWKKDLSFRRLLQTLSLLGVLALLLGAMPAIANAVNYYLPYATGYTATVSQNPLDCDPSHCAGGSSAYAYDFLLGGREVWATAPGTVVAEQKSITGQTGSYKQSGSASSGNFVVLRHADGSCTRYLHMAYGTVSLNVGDTVTQGQKLGVEGNTGYTLPLGGGHHLHFERDNCTSSNSMTISFVEGANNWKSQNSRGVSGSTAPNLFLVRVGGTVSGKANLGDQWTTLTTGADEVKASGSRIAIRNSSGIHTKDGLNGQWLHQTGAVDQYILSD